MIVAVPSERLSGEQRIALVPETIARLISKGIEVRVETGAGFGAWFGDEDFRRSGAKVESDPAVLLGSADLVVKIGAPTLYEVDQVRPGATLICMLFPWRNRAIARRLAERGITTIALERLPRTTAAQAMDVLSSQSTAAGYRAVIAAAGALKKFFPMLMTPAGTIAPARVLVVGAGVAGLQAIATARRLGAVVEAFDVRSAVREEVESLGAKFITAPIAEKTEAGEGYARELSETAQLSARAAVKRALTDADVCITTALVPNRRAPLLLTAEMVRGMRPGSIIVDLAAEHGGNCELTEAGKDVIAHEVLIIGRLNLAGEVAVDASRMYSRNIAKLIGHFYRNGALQLDFTDEITQRCVMTQGGAIVQEELQNLPPG
jgi:NAD(P) transhydrogenase subunit alpha